MVPCGHHHDRPGGPQLEHVRRCDLGPHLRLCGDDPQSYPSDKPQQGPYAE